MALLVISLLVGCGSSESRPQNPEEGNTHLEADGWQIDGTSFSVNLPSAPASPLKLHLDLGSSATSISATLRNNGSTSLDFGGIVQEGGLIKVCACEPGPLNLGSLPPGGCLRIKAFVVQTSSGVQSAVFRLEGLLDLSVTATLPSGSPVTSPGLVIGSSCD